jgi:hypothetical protein
MSGYVWDLSGTDNRCFSHAYGHLIHWIQFKLSMRHGTVVIPVTAAVDDDGLVYLEGDDVSLVGWNHRPTLLRDGLHGFDGMAVWKPSFHLLTVPTESVFGGARSVFSIARLDERRECRIPRGTDSVHLVPRGPAPTDLPPLRIAARYATGKPKTRRRE